MKGKMLCNKFFNLAWKISRQGVYDCFFDYSPHVGSISIYLGGPRSTNWIEHHTIYYEGDLFDKKEHDEIYKIMRRYLHD
jgi:hypothetical protein